LNILIKTDKLKEISLMIHQIDKDRNGYVTRNELDDILKENYPNELADKNLFPYINRFCSISNKILIDYKAFKEWIRMALLEAESRPSEKDTKSQLTEARFKKTKSNEAT
jgi:Ca2+-binding EF-hand superfamily protein